MKMMTCFFSLPVMLTVNCVDITFYEVYGLEKKKSSFKMIYLFMFYLWISSQAGGRTHYHSTICEKGNIIKLFFTFSVSWPSVIAVFTPPAAGHKDGNTGRSIHLPNLLVQSTLFLRWLARLPCNLLRVFTVPRGWMLTFWWSLTPFLAPPSGQSFKFYTRNIKI